MTNMPILIERINKTYKNIKKIKELDNICFPDIAPPVFGPKPTYCWVVKLDLEIIAYAIAYKVRNSLYLSRAGVLPKYRGKKIQQQLISQRIEKAKDLGLAEVVTYTSKKNIASIKNLNACGLEQCDMPEWLKIDNSEFICWKLDV